MPKLPVVSGKFLINKLQKYGYKIIRQKGSHVRLRHNNPLLKPLTVPLHKEIKPGLLLHILKDANLAPDDIK